MRKIIVLVWVFLQLPNVLTGQQTSVLDKDSILIGDQVWWTMILPQNTTGITGIETIEFKELPHVITEGVEALSPVMLDSVYRKKHLDTLKARVLLTSFDSGSYRIPDMPLYLRKPDGTVDTLWYKGPSLYVNTIPVDTTGFQAFGLKPQMRYPITMAEILMAAGLLLFLAGITWLIVRIVKRRKKNLPVFGLSRPKDPPHIAALKALEAMRKQKLWKKQTVKQYYTVLTDTVRVYLRDRWGIQAMEQTSAEMIGSLDKKATEDPVLTADIIKNLEDMLHTGDLAKFAKYTPSDTENETSLDQAVAFVTQTALVEEEKED
ncbi:MAG TPA: hypothetical protein P5167_01940 [Bacteroidales bacterium]|nr:hypothetical protein [Bacteroidales bacterium]HRW94586.1 hypothetical protein [Bacteroidales bacterium]